MKAFKVVVTRPFIDVGIQRDRFNCADVMGIKYANDDLERISVDKDWVRASSRSEQLRYKWPTSDFPALVKFLKQFDADKTKAKPHQYTIDPDRAVDIKPVGRQGSATMIRRVSRPRRAHFTGTGAPKHARVSN